MADWLEHVAATGGEPYLRTPEEDLPFLVRHSLDIAAVWAALLALLGLILAHMVRGALGLIRRGLMGYADGVAKVKAA